jgi:GNAT superfamily N-acetyltransferase
MPEYIVVTARAGKQFRELSVTAHTTSIPGFLDHDEAVSRYWSCLAEIFLDYQFCLVEKASGTAVARGHSIPVAFDGEWSALPDRGLDWVLEKAFMDHADGRRPTVYSALYIVVADRYRGRGLSASALAAMWQIGREQGFRLLIAPVRTKRAWPDLDVSPNECGQRPSRRWQERAGLGSRGSCTEHQ